MTRAIRIHEHGGPEVLRWEAVELGSPGPAQALVRVAAVGVNFIDTYHRTGLYPVPLPSGLGMEGAGIVEAVGEGVAEVTPGQRVAWASRPLGAYAERHLMPADRLVPLPEAVGFETAAAAMLKGLTAHYLLRRTYPLRAGETILFHAAAGGTGSLACRWAKHLGATVIGTVGSDAKVETARAAGCDHVIVTGREDFVARVREITGGAGVPVVYDSVGAATWPASLDCLRPMGTMVSFGNASGPVPPFPPLLLSEKGSLFLTRPSLPHYVARREDLLAAAAELFAVLTAGAVRVEVGQRFPLAEAARAHQALEARRTTGSTVLVP